MSTAAMPSPEARATRQIGCWRYGALGMPLAFVSLPLYVSLPHHYAERLGVPLAELGTVLLVTRLCDALLDPWLGRWIDRAFSRGHRAVWRRMAAAALIMALGFAALWQPGWQTSWQGPTATLVNLGVMSILTFVAYSVVAVGHLAWGARWGGDAPQRAAIAAWREGAALVGVVLAGALPLWLGIDALPATLAMCLIVGMLLLRTTSHERPAAASLAPQPVGRASPWTSPAFRDLLTVFMLNGIASAIPAALLPFFVADRLQATAQTPVCLLVYFLAAGLGLPLWVQLMRRLGLVAAWLGGMGLSVLAFAGVLGLQAGDTGPFLLVCAASGLALGADLVAPAALLAGIVPRAANGSDDGRYFGWWACANKLNAALAVGLVLPALAALGYAQGSRDAHALWALTFAYGALPCAFKLIAAATLWRSRRHGALKGVER